MFQYVSRRFERIVKLSRELVREIDLQKPDVSNRMMYLITLYADLLAQALLDGNYHVVGEKRLLIHMRRILPAQDGSDARLQRLIETLEHDREGAARAGISAKAGIVGMAVHEFDRWKQWIATEPAGSCQCTIGILSRAIADTAVTGRLCSAPVRFMCFSHRRMQMEGGIPLTSDWLARNKRSHAVLVDAHANSGKTIQMAVRTLADHGIYPTGILVTENERQDPSFVTMIPGSWKVSSEHGRSTALVLTTSASTQDVTTVQPIVAITGLPGSGKTLVRKSLRARTGWPSLSWSRSVRPLLQDFGGLSIEAVHHMTEIEESDPELIAREFLAQTDLEQIDSTQPLIVDGLKTCAAAECVSRHLGRPLFIVEVSRQAAVRTAAIAVRRSFDDAEDSIRCALLERVGIRELIGRAMWRIDVSDSGIDLNSGLSEIGPSTSNQLDALIGQVRSSFT